MATVEKSVRIGTRARCFLENSAVMRFAVEHFRAYGLRGYTVGFWYPNWSVCCAHNDHLILYWRAN